MLNKVAVYGSLRKGQGNYRYYLADSEHLVTERVKGFKMASMGGFPGAVQDDEFLDDSIVIEVYEVSPEVLKSLNGLEGYRDEKNHWYDRVVIETSVGQAYIYTQPKEILEKLEVVESGDWSEYMANRKSQYA